MRRPPSKPTPFKRAARDYFQAQYWEDESDGSREPVKRVRKTVTLYDASGQKITAKRKAQAACDDLHQDLLAAWNGTIKGGTRLSDYRDTYLSSHLGRKGTTRSYGTKLEQFLSWAKEKHGVIRFSDVRREHVKAFLDTRLENVKVVTVHGDLRALRAFFSEAVRDKHLESNPCKGIRLPKLGTNRISEGFFLPAEMDAIVEWCRTNDPEWYPVFAGYRYSPFRREEATFLEWSDIDFSRDVIFIRDEKRKYGWYPKRGGRTMDLHPALKSVLEGLNNEGPFVFPSPAGTVSTTLVGGRKELGRRAWRKVKVICKELKLEENDPTGSWTRRFPKGPHLKAFRSGISCELQIKGAPLAYVQNQLGHHDQALTLEHYTHLVPELMGNLINQFISVLGSTGPSNA